MTAVDHFATPVPTYEKREKSHQTACEDWPDCPGCVFDDVALCGADLSGSHACPPDLSCGCVDCKACNDMADALWGPEV